MKIFVDPSFVQMANFPLIVSLCLVLIHARKMSILVRIIQAFLSAVLFLASCALHEMGHAFAFILVGNPVISIQISGFRWSTIALRDDVFSLTIASVAGCFVGLVLALLLLKIYKRHRDSGAFVWLLISALMIAWVQIQNLIPQFPNDGFLLFSGFVKLWNLQVDLGVINTFWESNVDLHTIVYQVLFVVLPLAYVSVETFKRESL